MSMDPITGFRALSSIANATNSLTRLAIGPAQAQPTEDQNYSFLTSEIDEVNILVKEAKDILDEPEGCNLNVLTNLARQQIGAEICVDAINCNLKNGSKVDIKLKEEEIEKVRKKLQSSLNQSRQTNRRSGPRRIANIPPSNVRRCLLYLNRFHKDHILNCKRITRLSTAHEFSREDSNEPLLQQPPSLLQQLADKHWIKVVDKDMDGPSHFRIDNVVGIERLKWPETDSCFSFCDAWPNTKSIPKETRFPSFSFLGRQISIKMEKLFLPVRILTLRYVNLKNEEYLKNLSLLRYLDLKHTYVETCEWLKDLVELQVLDLRYTKVERIPDECLEKLVNLQHLLLGYISEDQVITVKGKRLAGKSLAGATLTIEKLGEKLKTLRAVRMWTTDKKENGIVRNVDDRNVRNVDDLFVTDLTKETLKSFWTVVTNFEKLTSLGIAVRKGSVVTLQDCPPHLMEKLKRLQMEGQIDSTKGIEMLSAFDNLVDLTLASPASGVSPVSATAVSPTPVSEAFPVPISDRCLKHLFKQLFCLRLYGICDSKTLKFGRFKNLKKMVIGGMKKVEKIQIDRAVIKEGFTLKLRDLPEFRELGCLKSTCPFLTYVSNVTEEETTQNSFEDVNPINIFLRDDHQLLRVSTKRKEKASSSKGKEKASSSSGKARFECGKKSRLKIYRYDMDKQCYEQFMIGDNMS